MDWNRVEGNWKQINGKVNEKWGNLTDDDLDKIAGRRDQLEENFRSVTGCRRLDECAEVVIPKHRMKLCKLGA